MSYHLFCKGILSKISFFRRDNKAQVAIMFGLALLPMLAFVGTAMDYSRASTVRETLSAAADATALDAVIRGRVTHVAPATASLLDFFNASAAGSKSAAISSFKVTSTNSATTLYVQIDYAAEVPTVFMNLFGYKTMTMTGSAKAATDLPPYIDFHLLLDNSPSMGVAGSIADIAHLQSLTPDGCAFACHQKNADGDDVMNDYYHIAKNNNVSLRIDLMRQAVQNLMDTASKSALIPNQFRMGLYTFSDTFQTIADVSADLAAQKALAGKIDLSYAYLDQNDMQTSFDMALPAVNAKIAYPGDGMTAGSPQKYLFFVTDGVQDERASQQNPPGSPSTRVINTLNPALCQTIKDRGIKIAVLYTPYLPLPTNAFYNQYVVPLDNQSTTGIVPTLTDCATPGFFFQIGGTQSIDQAMQAMFNSAVKTARLVR